MNLVFEKTVEPFEHTKLVTLEANNNWTINYTMEFAITFPHPDTPIIRTKIEQENIKMRRRIKEFEDLFTRMGELSLSDLIQELSKNGQYFLDLEFPPIKSAFSNSTESLDLERVLPMMVQWRHLEETYLVNQDNSGQRKRHRWRDPDI